MAKFKAGDFVYHKVIEQKGKGVIAGIAMTIPEVKYRITWADGTKGIYTEGELYSEKEWKEHNKPMTM